jgi:hypothetical protein
MKSQRRKRKVVFAGAASIVLAGAAAYAAELWVYPDGSGPYPNIQAAVDAAQDGDTVLLADGEYEGEGNTGITVGGKEITIRSASGNPEACYLTLVQDYAFAFMDGETHATVLEGIGITGEAAITALYVESSSPTFRNLKVWDTAALGAAGLLLENSNSLVEDCEFRNTRSWAYGAVVTAGQTSSATFLDCVLVNNLAGRGYIGGARSYGGGANVDNASFERCTFARNAASVAGGGLSIRGNVSFVDCVIWGNCAQDSAAAQMFLGAGANVSFDCSLVDTTGIAGPGFWQLGPDILVDTDPGFCEPSPCGPDGPDGDYRLQADSPCLPENSPCGRLMGALDEGCPAVSVRSETWGRIKAMFR